MDGTILCQGRFSSLGTNATNNSIGQADPMIVKIPSNADWMWVYNYQAIGSAGSNTAIFADVADAFVGVRWYWQRGMAAGTGIVEYKTNAVQAMNAETLVSGGFTLYDPSGQSAGSLPLLGAQVATTASTNATRPVVTTANTGALQVGSVVRMSATAQSDVNGIDMVVGAVTLNTSFTLLTASNPLANVPGAIGGAGFYRQVNVDDLFYPRHRYIVNITQAVNGQVSTSVAHGMTPGQQVRFSMPRLFTGALGMIELDGQVATVLSVVDDYNFTISIDTSAYTAFAWPTIAQQPSSFPIMVPVGEDTAASLSIVANQVPSIGGQQIFNTQSGILADATVNTGFLGMVLGSGGAGSATASPILGPAGAILNVNNVQSSNTIYWVAGKSSFGGL